MKMRSAILLVCGLIAQHALAQKPLLAWSFDAKAGLADKSGKKFLGSASNPCGIRIEQDGDRSYALLEKPDCLVPVNLFPGQSLSEFSVEFDFKGPEFYFTSYPKPLLRLVFRYDYIQFSTTTIIGGKPVTDIWVVRLNGKDVPSYASLADDEWHHIAFRASVNGQKEIVIDGRSYPGLEKKLDAAGPFVMERSDGFKSFSRLDELQLYGNFNGSGRQTGPVKKPGKSRGEAIVEKPVNGVDPKEFAPGYPDYTVQAIDQLRAFPSPRMPANAHLLRNFSWLDITYLHRQLEGAGGEGFGRTDPGNAVRLEEEMVGHWNYYLELVTRRQDSITANKAYADPNGLEHALIELANQHSQWPTSTIVMEAQIRPVHAGFDSKGPYINSQNLPDDWYLHDASGKLILTKGRKWLSPLAPLEPSTKDGQTTGFYLRQLRRYLNRPVTYINENGEVFGHMRPASLLDQDPGVLALKKKLGLDNSAFNGYFQNRLDSTYRENLLRSSGHTNSLFSIYDVSAVSRAYWPAYAQRIGTNSLFNGLPRSTPAFYPRRPSNWPIASGPDIGYGALADGRREEIALGVPLFAPFVSAGWSKEEDNIRPAQWLALLKSLVVMGADFFHVGYFNVTDSKGKWPDGKGPNDPRGYAYQVAMPVYAQALAARVMPYLTEGRLLPGDFPKDPFKTFRFSGRSESELILVRKLKDTYLIYGSLQPNSNSVGNVPQSRVTSINLEGKQVQFPIRRQGSLYVYVPGEKPVFYQLDGWHQYEHPFYWSHDILLEAELFDSAAKAPIGTESKGASDFSSFTSFITLTPGSNATFNIPARQGGEYRLAIRARTEQSATLRIKAGNRSETLKVSGRDWNTYRIGELKLKAQPAFNEYPDTITIESVAGPVQIDWINLEQE